MKLETLPLQTLKRLEQQAKPYDPNAQFRFVGGCVRDSLLGRTPKDYDIVTNTTASVLEQMGLENVGKAFPVYLLKDAELGQIEIAVARSEEKTGPGHKGFETVPTGNFEDDMVRRDLTINALSVDSEGTVRGPENAMEQIDQKVLQNVSDKFSEDPLRVFRVARFSAQFGSGWTISGQLKEQMRKVRHELSTLPSDRVREEFRKAMAGAEPFSFFETLRAGDCVDPWFSELEQNWGQVAQVIQYGSTNKWTFEQFLVGIGSVVQTPDSLMNRLGIREQISRAVHYVKANKRKLESPKAEDKTEVLRLVQSGSRGVLGFDQLLDCTFLGQNEEARRYLLDCQQALNSADMNGVKGKEEATARQLDAISKVSSKSVPEVPIRITESETWMRYVGNTKLIQAFVGNILRAGVSYWKYQQEGHRDVVFLSFFEGNRALTMAQQRELLSKALKSKLQPESVIVRALLKHVYDLNPDAEFRCANDETAERLFRDQEVDEVPTESHDQHVRMKELGERIQHETETNPGNEELAKLIDQYNDLKESLKDWPPTWKRVRASKDLIYVKVTSPDVVPKFLFYWFELQYRSGVFESMLVGAVIKGLTISDVLNMKFYSKKIGNVAKLSTVPSEFDFAFQRKGRNAGRPVWPNGDKLKISSPVPSEKTKSRTYWHGTVSPKAAKAIIREGIRPSSEVDPHLYINDESVVPQEGRVYMGRLDVALQYASGASGHVVETDRDRFIFKIDGNALIGDCEPDEDFVGALGYRYAGYTMHDFVDFMAYQPQDFALFKDIFTCPLSEVKFLKQAVEAAEDEADRDETPLFWEGTEVGWNDFVYTGNQILRFLSEEDKVRIIENFNAPVAHKGAIRPVAGWAIPEGDLSKIRSEADLSKFGKRIL